MITISVGMCKAPLAEQYYSRRAKLISMYIEKQASEESQHAAKNEKQWQQNAMGLALVD